MKYKRVLLKVSGEALSGKTPIDFEKATETALQIKALHDAGCLATFGADAPAEQWTEAAPIT